jgi:hypothetical protein
MASGSCQCGALRFEATPPSKWVAHCHCTMCRRAHGAAFVTWVGVEESRARIDDAQATLRWYASSPGAERGFCSHCGSMLFFRGQRWPGELHIVRANFDEPVDREPQVHVHYDTHVDWVALDPADGLPRKP